MEQSTLVSRKKLIVAMVGLPARGKTHYARKIANYINWIGQKAKVFTLSDYQRAMTSEASSPVVIPESAQQEESKQPTLSSQKSLQKKTLIEEEGEIVQYCREKALNDILNFLHHKGDVAVFDAANYTLQQRELVVQFLRKHGGGIRILWVEIYTRDKETVKNNIKQMKLTSPDFVNFDLVEVYDRIMKQCEVYEKDYQTLSAKNSTENISFIKIQIGQDQKIKLHNIEGYIPGKILMLLINLHTVPRPIYMSRHGQSQYNSLGKIGGDSELHEDGQKYAQLLGKWFSNQPDVIYNAVLYTSTMVRTNQTCQLMSLPLVPERIKNLDEINVGICDGMTYEEMEKTAEKLDYDFRKTDKLRYRYPRGESYLDLIERIEPVIMQIERQKRPVIVVAHQAVLRVVYSYFVAEEIPNIPHLDMPLHTIIKLVPQTYQVHETRISFNIETGQTKQQHNVTAPKVKSLQTPFGDIIKSNTEEF